MFGKILKACLMVSAVSTLAACASASGGKDAPFRMPEVTDPAPIISGTMRPYQIRGRWYHPKEQPSYDETGMASWYGAYHHGRSTSTGERFDMNALTAAHKTLPLPSLVEVTNPTNGRRVILRVNDRGPFVDSRIIDLSKGAAEELGLMSRGVGEVRVRYVGRAPRTGGGMVVRGSDPAPQPEARPRRTAETTSAQSSHPVPYTEVVRAEPAPAPVVAPAPDAAPVVPMVSAAPAIVAAPFPTPVLQPIPQSAPAVSSAPVPSGHWVQAGVYSDAATARRFADRLGGRTEIQPINSQGQIYYRILVGPWPNANAAERAREAVIARGYVEALLISGG